MAVLNDHELVDNQPVVCARITEVDQLGSARSVATVGHGDLNRDALAHELMDSEVLVDEALALGASNGRDDLTDLVVIQAGIDARQAASHPFDQKDLAQRSPLLATATGGDFGSVNDVIVERREIPEDNILKIGLNEDVGGHWARLLRASTDNL